MSRSHLGWWLPPLGVEAEPAYTHELPCACGCPFPPVWRCPARNRLVGCWFRRVRVRRLTSFAPQHNERISCTQRAALHAVDAISQRAQHSCSNSIAMRFSTTLACFACIDCNYMPKYALPFALCAVAGASMTPPPGAERWAGGSLLPPSGLLAGVKQAAPSCGLAVDARAWGGCGAIVLLARGLWQGPTAVRLPAALRQRRCPAGVFQPLGCMHGE